MGNPNAADHLTLMKSTLDQCGVSLWDKSRQSPLLLIFLRHSGCAFCREALAEIQQNRGKIESANTQIALVHMGDEEHAQSFFSRYGLSDVSRYSDPSQELYRSFDLPRGTWSQILHWKVWLRGFSVCILKGHGVGKLEGDVFQLPGAFLLHNGEIIKSFRHESPADRPNYTDMACGI